MSSSNHALASLVTQVTKVPDDSYTPNDASSGTPYGTPGTPSSLPLVKPHGATTTVESKRPSMLDFLIRSFAACFVKDANNNSPTTASPPSPSAPLTLQTAPAPPARTIEKPKEVAPKKPVTTNALIPEQSEDLKGRKLLVLDLDETLVHSCFQPVPNSDFIIPIVIEGVKHTVYVLKRPFVDDFLYEMSKIYEIVVFTASVALYANPLLDLLDPHRVIKHRLFREHCTFVDGSYVKDLSRLGRDMGDIIIIDNSKNCYKFQPDNAMPSITWLEDKRDNQLARMIPYLVRIGGEKQVYEGLREFREAESTIWTSGQQW